MRVSAWLVVGAFCLTGLALSPAQAAPARADLKVSGVTPAKTTVETGTKLKITVTTANSGNKQAGASKTRLVLSKDTKLSKDDKILKTLSVGKLAKGKSKASATTVTLPKVTGAWRLLACADVAKKVTESSESNNCRSVKLTVTPLRADLVVSAAKPATTSPKSGASLKVTVTTKNSGKASAAKSSTRLVLSQDTKVSSNDTVLKTLAVGALAKGKSVTSATTVTLPLVTGTWHLLACADSAKKVAESSETNNCRATKLTLAGPTPPPPPPDPTPDPSPTPDPTPTPDPDPDPDPDPGDWPEGFTLEVLPVPGVLELLPHERGVGVTVRAINNTGAATAPVDFTLRAGDLPPELESWAYFLWPVTIPAIPAGQSVDIEWGIQLPYNTPVDDVAFPLEVWVTSGDYESPRIVVDIVAVGQWALPQMAAEVDLPFSGLVVSDQITFEATVTLTNSGGGPSLPEESNGNTHFYVDCTICWGGGGWNPVISPFEIPAVPAGGQVVIPVEVTLPGYQGPRQWGNFRAWYEGPDTPRSPDAFANGLFVSRLDGRNLAVTGASAPLVGASVERAYGFRARTTVSNVGTQEPGDTVYVSAAILDQPTWDPTVPQTHSTVAEVADLPVGEARDVRIDLAWDGPVPAEPHYLVTCVNTSPDWKWEGTYQWFIDNVELEETTTADNCHAEELSFVDLDAPMVPAPGPSGVFPHTPAPVSVTPALAEEPAFTAAFAWQQTAVQSWSFGVAPGVAATVSIPHGVFIEDFDLAGTPVTLEVDEGVMPLDVLGAFDLDPGDLLGEGVFTITFTLTGDAAATDAADQVVFVADSDGANLRLAPLVENPGGGFSATVLTAGLDHLGIVGVGAATEAQREALAVAWPEHDDQQLQSALGHGTHDQRREDLAVSEAFAPGGAVPSGLAPSGYSRGALPARLLLAGPGDWDERVAAELAAWWNDRVIPAFDVASAVNATEFQIHTAVTTYLSWERQVQLVGLHNASPFSAMSAEGRTRMFDAIDRYANKVKARCEAGQVDAVPDMLSAMRMLQLWGMEDKTFELEAALPKCQRYKVSVDITMVSATPRIDGPDRVETVVAHGSWEPDHGVVRGVNFTSFEWDFDGVPATPSSQQSRFGFIVETKVKPNKRRGVGATMDFLIRFGPSSSLDASLNIGRPWDTTHENPSHQSPYPRGPINGPFWVYGPPAKVNPGGTYTWSDELDSFPATVNASVELSILNVPPGS